MNDGRPAEYSPATITTAVGAGSYNNNCNTSSVWCSYNVSYKDNKITMKRCRQRLIKGRKRIKSTPRYTWRCLQARQRIGRTGSWITARTSDRSSEMRRFMYPMDDRKSILQWMFSAKKDMVKTVCARLKWRGSRWSTHVKGWMTVNLVMSSRSPSDAWRELSEYCQVDRLADKRWLQREFISIEMEPGENPTKFVLQAVNNSSKQVELGVKITENIFISTIINGHSDNLDTPCRQLLDAEEKTSRGKPMKIISQKKIKLQKDTSGGVALLATITKTLGGPRCQLCGRLGHTVKKLFHKL